jgi:hypothetical protein
MIRKKGCYLKPLVLEDLLDGSILVVADQLCLKDNSKGTVANDFAVGIGKLLRLSRLALVGHDLDNL